MTTKSRINIVFGAMTIGKDADESRVSDLNEAKSLLDVFQSYGYNEVDTARFYGGGTCEEYLGNLGWQDRGIVMDTKCYPTIVFPGISEPWSHKPEDLRANLKRSLAALKTEKVSMWYLHGPDRSTPYIDTLRAVNELHKEGLFDKFGISNYMSWEVAQICEICDANGWIKPVAYQGVYNVLHRGVELELFSCLRHYGMGFYAYNPLGGGFLTGNIRQHSDIEKGSRFDADSRQGRRYRQRYWNDTYFSAIELVQSTAEKYGLRTAEVSLRWMTNHSKLSPGHMDAVIMGASSAKHVEQNIIDLQGGPLPDEVVAALDSAWELVKPLADKYFH